MARESWAALPLASQVDLDELKSAEQGLLTVGLLRADADRLVPDERLQRVCAGSGEAPLEVLLSLILEAEPPLWLFAAAADPGRLATELVPYDVENGLKSVIADPARRQAFLLARARTIDTEERRKLGVTGEEAIVRACRAELEAAGAEEAACAVRRVSLVSDELGYDVVAPRLDGSERRLEVKATRSSGREVTIFLSRNEYEVGLADPDWYLVLARIRLDGRSDVAGHTSASALTPLLPTDTSREGRWQVTQLRLDIHDLRAGLPAAASHTVKP